MIMAGNKLFLGDYIVWLVCYSIYILSNNRNLTVVTCQCFPNTNCFRNMRFTPIFWALKPIKYSFLSILVKN